jgi:RHS repeat-associated protein
VGNNSQLTYDSFGQTVKIVETASGTVTSTKQFIWDGSATMSQAMDATGLVTAQYFEYGQSISGASYTYSRDHLGSVREMTNSSGVIVNQIAFDSFGRATQVRGTTISDFQFATMYLHLTMFRVYNSGLGRWLSRDPLQEGAGATLYAYVGNNPAKFIDPLGLAYVLWSGGHPHIVFTDGGNSPTNPPNIGYGPNGPFVEPPGAIKNKYHKNYCGRHFTYNDALMRQAVNNVNGSNQWMPTNIPSTDNGFLQGFKFWFGTGEYTYSLGYHNSADYLNGILDEYGRLGGTGTLSPWNDY